MYNIGAIRERFLDGEYAISDHAIVEARKDGIEPDTVEKLEWVAINGKVIEEYPERYRILVYAEINEDKLPIHIIIDYSFDEEPVIVTSYVPDSRYWLNFQKRKNKEVKMIIPKKRKCPECGGNMLPKLINLLYKKEDCKMEVDVIGIPANVCGKCFYRIIPGKVAKYIDSLVDPVFESQANQKEILLPPPHIDIQFPAIDIRTA